MKILSWNVAGLRARLKNDDLKRVLFSIPNDKFNHYFDIVCLQETKCSEQQANLPCEIKIRYPYMIWKNTMGTTQRRGFSGTCIMSTKKPLNVLDHYSFDEEGRIIALEFDNFVLVNVYVPNSQKVESDRAEFRNAWDIKFRETTKKIKEDIGKQIIICGDLNVARTDNDIVDPNRKRNRVPGFLDDERHGIEQHLEYLDMLDVFRHKNPDVRISTYWSNFLKQPRTNINGWRIDYFLASKEITEKIKTIEILKDTIGSDHCPLYIEIQD